MDLFNAPIPKESFDNYKSPSPFPSDDINPAIKQKKEWCMGVAVAIWSQYCLNNTGLPYSFGTNNLDYTTLRLYAEGNQPVAKYKKILGRKNPDKDDDQRGTYNAPSWDNHSVLPRYERVIIEKLQDYEVKYSPFGIDDNSLTARVRTKNYIWERSQNKIYETIYAQLGVNPKDPLPFIPADKAELEMWGQMKLELAHELSMGMAVDYVFDESEWTDDIKQNIYRDLFRLGIAATYEYVEVSTGIPKIAYCDPAFTIFPKSNKYGYQDIDFAGDVIFMTVSDVRKQLKENGGYKTEEEFIQKLQPYINYSANSAFGQWGLNIKNVPGTWNFTTMDSHGAFAYDYLKVAVLRCEKKSWDTDVYSEIKTNTGETVKRKENYTYNKNDEKRKTVRKKYETWYKCWWVIGTDLCIDWGQKEYIKRDNGGNTYSGYTIVRTDNRSMVASMVPVIDEIELITKRFMMAWKNASPSGYAYLMSVLKNVSFKDKKIHPLDLINMQRDTGNIVIDDGYLKNIQGRAQSPIIPLAGGIGKILDEFMASYQFYRGRLADITGISDAMLGANPIPGQLKSTTEIALSGSENVIKPLGRAYNLIKKMNYNKIICDIHTIAKFHPEGFRASFMDLSVNTLQKIAITGEDTKYFYALKAKPEATELLKQEVLTTAKEASIRGQITYPDYLQIVRYVTEGDVRFAQQLIEYKLQKRMEQEQQINMQNIQANGEQQAQSLQMKAELDKKLIEIQGQVDAMLKKIEGQNAMAKQIQADNTKLAIAENKEDEME